jgi:hypothetical protein
MTTTRVITSITVPVGTNFANLGVWVTAKDKANLSSNFFF